MHPRKKFVLKNKDTLQFRLLCKLY